MLDGGEYTMNQVKQKQEKTIRTKIPTLTYNIEHYVSLTISMYMATLNKITVNLNWVPVNKVK